LIERYKASGKLLSDPCSSGSDKPRINENVESIIHKVVRKLYLDKQKRKISKIVQEVRGRCIEANITPPGQNTLRRRISQLSLEKVFEKRSGKLAAHPFRANHGPTVTAQYPLEIFMIDHTKVDVIIVDEQQRLPIGRPWLTLAIDVFSRCIAGFCLLKEELSNDMDLSLSIFFIFPML
jgi:putative transposase